MDQPSTSDRLSRISTLLTLLDQAKTGPADASAAAWNQLLRRYYGAALRYLLGALGNDEDAAFELFQTFAERFLDGAFRAADPGKGRFRQYLKAALRNLVNDHYRKKRQQPAPLTCDVPVPTAPEPESFPGIWRQELVNHTWEALAKDHPIFHAVLLSYADWPDLTSPRRAEELSRQLGKPYSAEYVRGLKRRAGRRFAGLLVEEVERALEGPTEAELLAELRALRLLDVCAPALAHRGLGMGLGEGEAAPAGRGPTR